VYLPAAIVTLGSGLTAPRLCGVWLLAAGRCLADGFLCPAPGQRCELIFDGIDTAATVRLNGALVGTANDMHLRFVFDVTTQLRAGAAANLLEVSRGPCNHFLSSRSGSLGIVHIHNFKVDQSAGN
jgi:hypothetical protein